MEIKLTEIVRATTITLKIENGPSGMVDKVADLFVAVCDAVAAEWKKDEPGGYSLAKGFLDPEKYMPDQTAVTAFNGGTLTDVVVVSAEQQEAARQVLEHLTGEQPAKRRGRPPKKAEPQPEDKEPAGESNAGSAAAEPFTSARTEATTATTSADSSLEPPKAVSPQVEPTPLERAIAETAKEDKEPQGENPTTESPTPAETAATPEATSDAMAAAPISDRDLQSYCVKVAQHYGGAAKVYDLCKPFVEEGAVARPSNIKGDDKRMQFIKAVEADSGVKWHG